MGNIVCKFGGSSLADEIQAHKVIDIMHANPDRRILVVSAPGKRFPKDEKVTDLLGTWYEKVQAGKTGRDIRKKIENRYLNIVRGLRLDLDLTSEFDAIAKRLDQDADRDYAESQGERLMGIVMSKPLRWMHIDPLNCLFINPKRQCDRVRTKMALIPAIGRAGGRAVISGFYGCATEEPRRIRTFTRGGSDTTGGEVAAATNASLYENWSDKDGMRAADPNIIPDARKIILTSYYLSREFGLRGVAEKFIFHPAATIAVEDAGVPTRILNTNNTSDPGTLLVSDLGDTLAQGMLGVTGRRDCHLIEVYRRGMDDEVGDMRAALSVLEKHRIPVRHPFSGTDSFSFLVYSSDVGDRGEQIEREIKAACEADYVEVLPDAVSVVTVVGGGMKGKPGSLVRFAQALANAKINCRQATQDYEETSISFVVPRRSYEDAIRELYPVCINW